MLTNTLENVGLMVSAIRPPTKRQCPVTVKALARPPSLVPRGGIVLDGNMLYYGDNLKVLREHVPDACVDLVYLDPPFNSNQDYNVLFKESGGQRSEAQITAFDDTWHWDHTAALMYEEIVTQGPERVAATMEAFRRLLGESDMLAYLSMMAPRLVHLWRVLKPTGSIYLHCDPTASAHLRLLMDAVFGAERFRSEIVWKRSHAHNSARRYGPNHDTILFYAKGEHPTWSPVFQEYDAAYVAKHYRHVDNQGRHYKHENPTGPGTRHGPSGNAWRGIDPTAKGRHWMHPPDELERLDQAGLIHWPKQGGWPYLIRYLDESMGIPAQDVWTDIAPINMQAAERLGYPTQKPEALLERILRASSNEGDTVLDPFCGCGTAVAVAQRLKRRWIGIDITHLAVNLIRTRLRDAFGQEAQFRVVGEPEDLAGAHALAAEDPFQFQCWALGLVGARPAGGIKKGADKGIDGRLRFIGDAKEIGVIVLQVKAGHVGVRDVRDLRGVIEREDARIGVLLTMEQSTQPMRTEAASAGFYQSSWTNHSYARLQILTVEDLLAGRQVDFPTGKGANVTLKRAPRAKGISARNLSLFGTAEGEP